MEDALCWGGRGCLPGKTITKMVIMLKTAGEEIILHSNYLQMYCVAIKNDKKNIRQTESDHYKQNKFDYFTLFTICKSLFAITWKGIGQYDNYGVYYKMACGICELPASRRQSL